MESIQDESKALNVWHIKDAITIYINWVKGSIPEWTEKAYSIPKYYILWRDHKLEIDGAVEQNNICPRPLTKDILMQVSVLLSAIIT